MAVWFRPRGLTRVSRGYGRVSGAEDRVSLGQGVQRETANAAQKGVVRREQKTEDEAAGLTGGDVTLGGRTTA